MEPNTPIAEATKTFEDIKNDLISLAEENDACSDATEELENSENIEQLLQVVKDNISWCCRNIEGCASLLVKTFGNELLHKFNIYTSSQHSLSVTEKNTVIALLGSSSATVETWDSSSATVKTLGSSSATVKTLGSSSANIGRYHSSKLEYSLGEGTCPLIKHFTEKKVFVKTSEFEIVQVSK